MTEQEKQLLLKDLCARLPYKPRVKYGYSFIGVAAISGYTDEGYLNYDELKDFSIFPKYGLERKRVSDIIPYLRPMSSMTKEETVEYNEAIDKDTIQIGKVFETPNACMVGLNALDWLNAHHFDYRGLITMGLALEAPEGMYDTKTE